MQNSRILFQSLLSISFTSVVADANFVRHVCCVFVIGCEIRKTLPDLKLHDAILTDK